VTRPASAGKQKPGPPPHCAQQPAFAPFFGPDARSGGIYQHFTEFIYVCRADALPRDRVADWKLPYRHAFQASKSFSTARPLCLVRRAFS
jgi:hypothetical protein